MSVLVLDFGGSSVKYGLVSRNGEITEEGKVPAPLGSIDAFQKCVSKLYEMYADKAEGISISIPGYVDAEKGILVGSGAYRELYGKNIVELIKSAVKAEINVAVENDGKCGALAEAWNGALSDCADGVVLILGSGIAGGVIKDHKIHAGKTLAAGEFSNYIVNPQNPSFLGLAVMNCAAFGLTYKLCKAKNLDLNCQDLSAELIGIDSAFGGAFPKYNEAPIRIKADGIQLSKWLEEKDPEAEKVYQEFLSSLAFMIENIQITFAPEKIVIGGGLSRLPSIEEDLKNALNVIYTGTGFGPELQATIAKSVYLDECNMIGAANNYYSRF